MDISNSFIKIGNEDWDKSNNNIFDSVDFSIDLQSTNDLVKKEVEDIFSGLNDIMSQMKSLPENSSNQRDDLNM